MNLHPQSHTLILVPNTTSKKTTGLKISRTTSQKIGTTDPLITNDDFISLDFYDNLFLLLNSQKTIIDLVHIDFPDSEILTENDKKAVEEIKGFKDLILNSTYGKLFKNANLIIQRIQTILKDNVSPNISKKIFQFLKPITHIYRIINILDNHIANPDESVKAMSSFDKYKTKPGLYSSPNSSSQSLHNQARKKGEKLIICRICEKPVFKSQFDEHIKTCYAAFKSTEPIAQLDEQLNHIKKILKRKLDIKWPAKKTQMLQIMIPVHVIVLIDKLMSQYQDYDQFYKIYASVLTTLTRMAPYSPKADSPLIAEIIALTKKKVIQTYYSYQFKKDAQTSTVDCDEPLNPSSSFVGQAEPSIADFVFLKQISAGAFARVFLCGKKSTKDIFAVKAVPKKFLKQKENLKTHILHEKDFLFHLSSEYIVKICMYLIYFSWIFYFQLILECNQNSLNQLN